MEAYITAELEVVRIDEDVITASTTNSTAPTVVSGSCVSGNPFLTYSDGTNITLNQGDADYDYYYGQYCS